MTHQQFIAIIPKVADMAKTIEALDYYFDLTKEFTELCIILNSHYPTHSELHKLLAGSLSDIDAALIKNLLLYNFNNRVAVIFASKWRDNWI